MLLEVFEIESLKVFFKKIGQNYRQICKMDIFKMSKMKNLNKLLSKKSEKNYCTTKL